MCGRGRNTRGGPWGTAAPLCILTVLASGSLVAQTSPERRTALDGTVVLEDAPEVPDRVVDALNRYQNGYLDPERVAVYGGSYGGYMVLASLVQFGERLRAGDYVGISNFVTFLENTEDYRRDLRRPEYGDERDPSMRAFLESISPANHADEIESALFVVQGANDPRIPATESEQIAREVRANENKVWTMTAENEGHGFAKKPNQDLLQQIVFLFFEENLLPREIAAAATRAD